MAFVGICGSDVHYFVNGKIGDFVVEKPMIIGHESSGTVIQIGKLVKNLEVGDRVAIEPGVPCRICKFCKIGRYNLCKDIKFCATPPVHGSLQRFFKHAADFCLKLPKNVSLEEGALLEPLSVAFHACKRAEVKTGSSVLILGAGPIGLAALTVAKAMGAKTIIADLNQYKLKVAKKLSADAVHLIRNEASENENVKQIYELFNKEPDISIDATGVEASIRLAVLVTRSGGVSVFVGMGSENVNVPFIHALVKEIDIRGVFRYANDYADALDLVTRRKAAIAEIVSHKYKLEETMKAFETARSNRENVVKVLIHCG